LEKAAANGHHEIVKVLIDAGVDLKQFVSTLIISRVIVIKWQHTSDIV